MAKNKTENSPIRMDDDTWVKLKELAENRKPQESRPSLLNRLVWEESARVESAQSAPDADPAPEPEAPQSSPAEVILGPDGRSDISDDELEWEDIV